MKAVPKPSVKGSMGKLEDFENPKCLRDLECILRGRINRLEVPVDVGLQMIRLHLANVQTLNRRQIGENCIIREAFIDALKNVHRRSIDLRISR